MLYRARENYFKSDPRKALESVLPVVVQAVGQWCNYYRVGVYEPDRTIKLPFKWKRLPPEPREKQTALEKIVAYVLSGREPDDFLLWLDPKPIRHFFLQNRIYMFDHHDDIYSWVLTLTVDQFLVVQEALDRHGLPKDLFLLSEK